MGNEYIMKLQAVINTLNSTMIRTDQIDAIQRIAACTNELNGMMNKMREEMAEEKGES